MWQKFARGDQQLETVLLDSNVVIAFLDPKNDNHKTAFQATYGQDRRFVISVFSVIECLVNAYSKDYEYAINYELSIRTLIKERLDINNQIAIKSAELVGKKIALLGDAIIWATAEFHGLVLWTLDRRLANKSPNIRYLLES